MLSQYVSCIGFLDKNGVVREVDATKKITDKKEALKLLEEAGTLAFECFSEEIKRDREILNRAIEINPKIVIYIEGVDEDIVLKASKKDPSILEHKCIGRKNG